MNIDEQLEALVRRAVREELADERERLLAHLHGAHRPHDPATAGTPSDDDDEVTTKTAAALAHVKPRTINDWRRRGWLTPIKRGRSHVFRAGDVLAVARNRGAPRKILDYEVEAKRILSRKAL